MDPVVALPVKIQPGLLRPLAYRVLSKKYGLNIKSDGLAALADYIGNRFGMNWRKDSGTFKFLEQFAAIWDQQERGLFIDRVGVEEVIKEVKERSKASQIPKKVAGEESQSSVRPKTLDNFLANRQPSAAEQNILPSSLVAPDVDQDVTDVTEEAQRMEVDEPALPTDSGDLDWQDYFKIIDAFAQQNFIYDHTTRQYRLKGQRARKVIPQAESNVAMFANRYHVVKDRVMRNDLFQGHGDTFNPLSSIAGPMSSGPGSFSSQNMTITQIKNLLGRDGRSFLLLGLLRPNYKGGWSLEDPSGSVEVDLSQAIPTVGTFYVSGCILLAEGIYFSAGHKFHVASLAHPPGERREATMDAIGNLDLLGVHQQSSPNYISRIDKDLKIRMHLLERELTDHRFAFLGGDLFLDQPQILEALRKVFAKLEGDPPTMMVLQGSFSSAPLFPVMSSKNISATSAYKNNFDALALLLLNFERLINETTFVFIPGNNDPWSSTVSLGTAGVWPQKPIPGIFAQRINRVCKKIHWGSNPTRVAYLSQELILVRDDINGRFKRHNIAFPAIMDDEEYGGEVADSALAQDALMPELNDNYEGIDQLVKSQDQLAASVQESRRLVKTILDQGHISPFVSSTRPVIWNLDHTLHLTPIPSLMVICDTTASQFEVTYNGCKSVNVGSFLYKRRARYVEYRPSSRKVVREEVYF